MQSLNCDASGTESGRSAPAHVRVPLSQVRALAERLLLSFGHTASAATFIVEVLLYAQAGGNNQGVVKLLHDGTGSLRVAGRPSSAPTSGDVARQRGGLSAGTRAADTLDTRDNADAFSSSAACATRPAHRHTLFDPPSAPPPSSRLRFVRSRKLAARIDGRGENGMIAMAHATHAAVMRADQHGIGVVGTRGTNTGTGAIGYYARWIAARGHIGVVCSGSSPNVAPCGAREKLLGTNPLAYGLPTARSINRRGGARGRGAPGENDAHQQADGDGDDDGDGDGDNNEPIVFDMSTSAVTYWGVREAATAGQSLPDNVALDAHGRPTTDPRRVDCLLPVAGYKGFGLGLLIEALTGPFVGAAFADVRGDERTNWGNLVLAIDPQLIVGDDDDGDDGGAGDKNETSSNSNDEKNASDIGNDNARSDDSSSIRVGADRAGADRRFGANLDALARRIRAAQPDEHHDSVTVPGDRGAARRRDVRRTGELTMERALLDALRQAAKEAESC